MSFKPLTTVSQCMVYDKIMYDVLMVYPGFSLLFQVQGGPWDSHIWFFRAPVQIVRVPIQTQTILLLKFC